MSRPNSALPAAAAAAASPSVPARREFLRTSGRAAAGLLLAPTLLGCGGAGATQRGADVNDAPVATPTGPTRKLGVAILGLGGYARGQIAPALQLTEHCELRGLITGSPEKLPEWRARYGVDEAHCYTYDRMAEIADDDAIDVVYVITPTSTHKDFTLRAAAAGKHVWCEKPMALTVPDCRAMIDACAAAGVQLTIGYRMLHEPNTRAFVEHARARPMGTLTAATARAGYAGTPPPADYWRGQRHMGGGALYDMGVYAVNGLRYATQAVPEAVVRAEQRRQDRPDGVDLTTTFTLRFPGGLEADGATSVVERYNLLRVEGPDGWAQLQPMQQYSGVRGEASDGTTFGPPIESPHQQRLQMDDDARAILAGTPPIAPGREGLVDVAIIRAIVESAERGGAEVPIGL